MAIVLPDVASTYLLDQLLDAVGWWVHLFVNDITPGPATILTDFVEPATVWYAPQQVKGWSNSIIMGQVAVSYAFPIEWVVGPVVQATSVYGYFVTAGKTGALGPCELNPSGPIPMTTQGAVCAVFPRFTLRADPQPE